MGKEIKGAPGNDAEAEKGVRDEETGYPPAGGVKETPGTVPVLRRNAINDTIRQTMNN